MIAKFRKILTNIFFPHLRPSYSQSGEDIIIYDLFIRLGIPKPTYLDIGANEPIALSNTYKLYKKGCHGVCIEPNPALANKHRKTRPRDKILNAGIAFDEKSEAEYYLFGEGGHGFSTFSRQDAEFWSTKGTEKVGRFPIIQILKLPLLNINTVIKEQLTSTPNLISLDVEGLDLNILYQLNFEKYSPEVICVETLNYGDNNKESKNNEIITFLENKGYFIFADTYINSIFCLKSVYQKATQESS